MDINKEDGQYTVKGGKTIIGKIHEYQKNTGASLRETLDLPYIFFVLSMADAPYLDKKEEKKKVKTKGQASTLDEELEILNSIFK